MSAKATSKIAIGIDLGTTNCCVAVYKNGKVEVIHNGQGDRTTPSVVAFKDGTTLIGMPALSLMTRNSKNTIYGAKRMIGRWFKDQSLQADIAKWPFKVVDRSGLPKIQVQHQGSEKEFSPEEISSMVLKEIKKIADDFLEVDVKQAVITVPAHFNHTQRLKTQLACIMAGMEPISIINEPTAAAIAYAIGKDVLIDGIEMKRTILVFDVGGGTLDVTILRVEGTNLEVKATSGDSHLAGEDFTNNLFDYFARQFREEHGTNITGNAKASARLRKACEKAKRNLSFHDKTNIDIDALYDGIDFEATITGSKFEEINMDLFKKSMTYVEQALEEAQMKVEAIDDVVLVGGSTRIPIFERLLKKLFNNKEIKKGINPDEGVAIGAAFRAASLTNAYTNRNILLQEVTPLSLGIEVNNGTMHFIINKNSKIPCSMSRDYTTVFANQKAITAKIYQGERPIARENVYLGVIVIEDILDAPPGVPTIRVVFKIDESGMLTVEAYDRKTPDKVQKLVITRDEQKSDVAEISELLKNAKLNKEEDDKEASRLEAIDKVETYCHKLDYFFSSKEMKWRIDWATLSEYLTKVRQELQTCRTKSKEEAKTQLTDLEHYFKFVLAKYQSIMDTMFKKEY